MPAIKGCIYIYINTLSDYSQPALIKLDNENIGGHLTPLHSVITYHCLYHLRDIASYWSKIANFLYLIYLAPLLEFRKKMFDTHRTTA